MKLYHLTRRIHVPSILKEGIKPSKERCGGEDPEPRRRNAVFAYTLSTLKKIALFGAFGAPIVVVFETEPGGWFVGDLAYECTNRYQKTVRPLMEVLENPKLEDDYIEMECFLPSGHIPPEKILEVRPRRAFVLTL